MRESWPAKVLVVLILLFWPTGFLLANSSRDLLFFLLPNLFILASVILYRLKVGWWLLPLVGVGLMDPQLSVFPVVSMILYLYWKHDRKALMALLLATAVFLYQVGTFYSSSVFVYDRDTYQQKIEKMYLYPNVWLARIFQNKATIYVERVRFNFFALIDLNNYFFNFHPREIVGRNQNLDKYPFWAVVPFIVGLYRVAGRRWRQRLFLLVVAVGLLADLSLLANFDRFDLVLYLPVSMVIAPEVKKLRNGWTQAGLIVVTLVEYFHLLLRYV